MVRQAVQDVCIPPLCEILFGWSSDPRPLAARLDSSFSFVSFMLVCGRLLLACFLMVMMATAMPSEISKRNWAQTRALTALRAGVGVAVMTCFKATGLGRERDTNITTRNMSVWLSKSNKIAHVYLPRTRQQMRQTKPVTPSPVAHEGLRDIEITKALDLN